VTSKSGTLEKKDDIKKRIKEAEKFVALDQLCLSPQCGFASTEEGNVLTEEAQWNKMKMILEITKEVWGVTPMPGHLRSLGPFAGQGRALLVDLDPSKPLSGNESAHQRPHWESPWPWNRRRVHPKPS
jgi:hypothetical protein